jgi:hypothetical protein
MEPHRSAFHSPDGRAGSASPEPATVADSVQQRSVGVPKRGGVRDFSSFRSRARSEVARALPPAASGERAGGISIQEPRDGLRIWQLSGCHHMATEGCVKGRATADPVRHDGNRWVRVGSGGKSRRPRRWRAGGGSLGVLVHAVLGFTACALRCRHDATFSAPAVRPPSRSGCRKLLSPRRTPGCALLRSGTRRRLRHRPPV